MISQLKDTAAAGDVRLERRSADSRESDLEELSRSLREPLPRIPSRFFYDDVGSELFEQICELPEYYPTRTERALLERIAPEIAATTRAETLIEIGSGAATKTRLLLDALAREGTLRLYVPIDNEATPLAGWQVATWGNLDFDLYDHQGRARWLVHPAGLSLDVVALDV